MAAPSNQFVLELRRGVVLDARRRVCGQSGFRRPTQPHDAVGTRVGCDALQNAWLKKWWISPSGGRSLKQIPASASRCDRSSP